MPSQPHRLFSQPGPPLGTNEQTFSSTVAEATATSSILEGEWPRNVKSFVRKGALVSGIQIKEYERLSGDYLVRKMSRRQAQTAEVYKTMGRTSTITAMDRCS